MVARLRITRNEMDVLKSNPRKSASKFAAELFQNYLDGKIVIPNPEDEETYTTAITMSDDLKERVEAAALAQNLTMSKLLRLIIKARQQ